MAWGSNNMSSLEALGSELWGARTFSGRFPPAVPPLLHPCSPHTRILPFGCDPGLPLYQVQCSSPCSADTHHLLTAGSGPRLRHQHRQAHWDCDPKGGEVTGPKPLPQERCWGGV